MPLAETVHERASVEIFRGCTRGCRFCQAGMITRPVRERSLAGHRRRWSTRPCGRPGFDEVGLLSLSSADHTEIAEITKGLADRYEGTHTVALAALHPRRRVQHRPRQRDQPQRAPLRPHVRARGRLGADPPGDQQDGVGGRPHPHRLRGVRAGLAAGQAVLHVRAAHRGGRGRRPDRGHGAQRDQGRARGVAGATTCAARSRSAGSCPSRTRRSSGPRRRTPTSSTGGCASSARRSTPTASSAATSACATTTGSPR